MRFQTGVIGAILCASVAPLWAQEQVSTRTRTQLLQNQISILDDRAATQYAGSERLLPPRADLAAFVSPYQGSYSGPYLPIARAAAQNNNIPVDLFLRLVQQESGWNAQAVSSKGALGLAQLMPQTAAVLGVDPTDPTQNLQGGARYLRQQYNTFGNWRLALAAYNAGPGAVERYGDVPPYAETQNYVQVILGQ
ncbi:lytic transglycosylase domain-containing protein [Yoonia sp. I 8.24]|uniref:lytic transglycosylase domain-containing protein n=1 Tax=Yoonia sp. I 8.24 TaxID=1537229 RepID=UPI001EE05715|nr:lytic transglycosylase domain-containing protein [Yoonia sp. I 8.24]MCG3266246.1 lytic transglycosylase domain-containing protein [Yoonia sp. I 8.24]